MSNPIMKEAIRTILSEFYDNGIPDDVVLRDSEFAEIRGHATVILGMRRTGKTYFAYARMRELLGQGIPLERIVYVNFDDARLAGMTVHDLRYVQDVHAELCPAAAAETCWYFLDELQDIKDWELFARQLIDSNRVRLCLTGSSAKLLAKEVATSMRGRSLQLEIFPLSFREWLVFSGTVRKIPRYVDTTANRGLLRKAFSEYMRVGGFPGVQHLDDKLRIRVLQEYMQSVVYRDVIERHEIANVQSLLYVKQYLLHNFARGISLRAISGVLKQLGLPSSREALADYVSYFQDAYFAFGVSRRTDSLAVKRANPDKCYLIDNGLIAALKPKNDAEKGWLLENVVFLGLRRGFSKIEYYITKSGREIDFVVRDEVTKAERLVQVCYDLSQAETERRELAALREARAETGIADCTIVVDDEERETEDGIRILPAWKWLLNEGAER